MDMQKHLLIELEIINFGMFVIYLFLDKFLIFTVVLGFQVAIWPTTVLEWHESQK